MDSSVIVYVFLLNPLFWVIIIYILIKIFRNNTLPRLTTPSYGIQSFTDNGEVVKSFSEKRIADYFKKNNIKYVYEQSPDYAIRNPDFYLPDYDVYVEYWGLLNADNSWTRENYERKMRRKMAIYHKRNKRLISIYPQNLENLDWIFRKKFNNATGFDLPN